MRQQDVSFLQNLNKEDLSENTLFRIPLILHKLCKNFKIMGISLV